MTHRITIDNRVAEYPRQPPYDPQCPVNVAYKTLSHSGVCDVKFKDVAVGPASIKQLYSGLPNHYPLQRTVRPCNTMYGMDLSQFHENGKRMSYHYKVWPLTHRHVRETREYSSEILPYMDNREWTRYPVETDVGTGRWYP